MPTKITLIYSIPADTDAFEAGYAEQPELVNAIPGLERLETSKVWPKEDGTPPPAYRMVDMYFPDYETASDAVTTPQASALFGNLGTIAGAGVMILFSEIEP